MARLDNPGAFRNIKKAVIHAIDQRNLLFSYGLYQPYYLIELNIKRMPEAVNNHEIGRLPVIMGFWVKFDLVLHRWVTQWAKQPDIRAAKWAQIDAMFVENKGS